MYQKNYNIYNKYEIFLYKSIFNKMYINILLIYIHFIGSRFFPAQTYWSHSCVHGVGSIIRE